jgi:hypothetical protein
VQRGRVPFVALIAAASIAVSAAPAASQDAGGAARRSPIARDISFPQCGAALPKESSATSGVLGTNNGTAFSRNPCLVAELRWAKRLADPPAFYANTGNPGPDRSKRWPLGQTTPSVCAASDPNSIGCSYDYGWNAAKHSFATAADAAQRLHHVDPVSAHRRAANVDWWLDVEMMNTWQATESAPTRAAFRRDVASLAGEVAALRALGVDRIGIYSTPYQWKVITGGSAITGGRFAALPQWLAGFESHDHAVTGCSRRGFTGGPVRLTQYLGHDGFDANVVCAER